jgi:hypothetical protein
MELRHFFERATRTGLPLPTELSDRANDTTTAENCFDSLTISERLPRPHLNKVRRPVPAVGGSDLLRADHKL